MEDPDAFQWVALGLIASQYLRHVSYSGHMHAPRNALYPASTPCIE